MATTEQDEIASFRPGWGLAAILVALITSVVFVAISSEDLGLTAVMLSLPIGAGAVGALIGFLLAAPGIADGEDGVKAANAAGWGARLGVFGSWLAGGAFALVLTNGSTILHAFLDLTAFATQDNSTYQIVVGANMVVLFVLGVVVASVVMAVNGQQLFRRANGSSGTAGGSTKEKAPK